MSERGYTIDDEPVDVLTGPPSAPATPSMSVEEWQEAMAQRAQDIAFAPEPVPMSARGEALELAVKTLQAAVVECSVEDMVMVAQWLLSGETTLLERLAEQRYERLERPSVSPDAASWSAQS